jgi:hypothetical protein
MRNRYEPSPTGHPLGDVLLAAFASLWALVTLAFLLHTFEQGAGARAAVSLLCLDGFDLACSDLDGGPGTHLAHAFSVCAAWVMPVVTLALVVALLRRRWRSGGSAS